MKKEIIETGKTVDEAIESACEKLGCEREDCEWEIIDLPRKGFLGLKNTPARVRVAFGEDEAPPAPKPAPAPVPPVPKKQEPPAARPAPQQQQQAQPPKPAAKPQPKPAAPAAPTAQQAQPAATPAPTATPEPIGEPIELVGDLLAKAEAAKSYLAAVLAQMELHPELTIVPEETGVCINVQGDGLGAIIGRRGETLDSLQYLTGLVVNRLEGEYLRVTVDCGNYRLKRRATLEALAHKLSGQVLKTNVSKTLEPMNPFERRIIHSTVSTIEGVSSTSVGEEPNRRVVITSPTARPPRPRSNDRRSGGRDGRDYRDSRGGGRGPSRSGGYNNRGGDRRRPPSGDRRRDSRPMGSPSNTAPAIPPTEAKDIDSPLYSKIDLE